MMDLNNTVELLMEENPTKTEKSEPESRVVIKKEFGRKRGAYLKNTKKE